MNEQPNLMKNQQFIRLSSLVSAIMTKLRLLELISKEDYDEIMLQARILSDRTISNF